MRQSLVVRCPECGAECRADVQIDSVQPHRGGGGQVQYLAISVSGIAMHECRVDQ